MIKVQQSRYTLGQIGIAPVITVVFLLGISLLTGCTAEGYYRSSQISNQQQCRQLPEPQQAHCLSLYDTSYDEYRREREIAEREENSD